MKVTAVLNGVKKVSEIPVSWDQVTFKQLLDIMKIGDNPVGRLAYFVGIEEETLRKATIKNLELVMGALQFLSEEPDADTVPSKVLGYPLPKKLAYESVNKWEDIKDALKKVGESGDPIAVLNLYPMMVGTYAMKEYDALTVDEFSEQFFNAPCREVLAVGNFTSMRLIGLKHPTEMISHRVATVLKRLRRAIKNWLKSLGFTLRFYLWKRRHNIKGTNS